MTPMTGDLAGKPTAVTAFTGQSPAGYVEDYTGVDSDDNMSVHISPGRLRPELLTGRDTTRRKDVAL